MPPIPTLSEAATIDAIFRLPRTLAVVGLSPRPERESYGVAAAMQGYGWRVVPINPNARPPLILGQACYPSLEEAAEQVPGIALVNVFRRSEEALEVAMEAIAIGAQALWLQLGVESDEAVALAQEAGLWVVQNRCIKLAWRGWRLQNPA